MKKLISRSYSSLAVLSLALAMFITGFGAFAAVGIPLAVSVFAPSAGAGVAYAGLNKEIWLPDLMEDFYGDDMFITEMRDMSAFVENNTINLAEAGVNPDVLVNNSVYPVPYSGRTDAPIAIQLDTFDTENTWIKNTEVIELAYDKRASVLYGHRQALRMTFLERAAHNVAPATDSTFTPKLQTTGANNADTGLKRLTYSDILKLKKRFDNAEIPAEGRILVLSAQHQEDLELEDAARYNLIMDKGVLRGFKLYFLAEKRLPRYNKTTGVKVAYGAASLATDSYASIAFHKDEVMRSQGDADMFLREKDPELRGDLVGFQMRGISLPIRGKGIASIYSPANA